MEGVRQRARSVGGLGRWSLECPAGCKVWLLIERATDRVLVTAWLATGSASPPHQVCPPWHTNHDEEDSYVRDRDRPHRGSTRPRCSTAMSRCGRCCTCLLTDSSDSDC